MQKLNITILSAVFTMSLGFSFGANADDADSVKQGLLSTMSSGIASSIAEVIGTGRH